jgi:hypothetical protein
MKSVEFLVPLSKAADYRRTPQRKRGMNTLPDLERWAFGVAVAKLPRLIKPRPYPASCG